MPITPFLDGKTFDPETRRVMGVAFEMTCAALGLTDRGDLANNVVAQRIIELANAGERNPDILCEQALKGLSKQPRAIGWMSRTAFGPESDDAMSSRAEQYRHVARECLTLANTFRPGLHRDTLIEMALEWERLADEQDGISDLDDEE